jgi:N-methylhydantoinase A
MGTGNGRLRIGVDIGGTFTDIVVSDATGKISTKKVLSNVEDFAAGIVDGVRALMSEEGLDITDAEEVVHATTVATNAVLESKGAVTGLITTQGFRDVLEFRRVRVPELYNLDYVKPPPLVPRRLRFEVCERLGADGSVRVPLEEESVRAAGERLKRAGVQAVAICLLHAYANPAHETRVAEIVRSMLSPNVFVSCSHEILPEMREYERTSTTVVNAYLGPLMRRYLAALRERLVSIGVRARLSVMQSNGSRMGVAAATEKPAYLVESGPAAGVIAAARIAGAAGLANVIALDIGGTTAKVAIVEDGVPTKTGEYEVGGGINLSSRLVKGAGYAIKLPFIDVSEIGAGGGSHVWFDAGGLLKVGPTSAGASPGPVCYGRGGSRATLTDALATLGYLDAGSLVGGELKIDAAAARAAIEAQLAEPMGISANEAAFGAFRVAIANLVRAVKSVSTNRGRDPRDYTLVAFGGNGPLLAASIAGELSMSRVLVPPSSGVLSAVGLLVADHAHEFVQGMHGSITDLAPLRVARTYLEVEARAVEALLAEGVARGDIEVTRRADLRYVGQAFELTVPAGDGNDPDLPAIAAAFHDEHLRTYGHCAKREPVEVVALRVIASVHERSRAERIAVAGRTPRPRVESRVAYFGPQHGLASARVLGRAEAGAGRIAGPAIFEEYDSTILVPPGAYAELDARGNVAIFPGSLS